MALTWDLTKINNHEEICWDEKPDGTGTLNSYTEGVIFLSMFIGIGDITEDNASEFYSRAHFYESLFGAFVRSHDDGVKKDCYITPRIIESHIGLHTNAGKETELQWSKRMVKIHLSESRNKYDNKVSSLV